MLRIRIGRKLIVNVVILDAVDQVLSQYSVDGVPGEQIFWVVWWDYLDPCL